MNNKELTIKTDDILTQVEALNITNDEQSTSAQNLLKDVNSLIKEIDNTTKPTIEAAHKAHKAALAQKNTYMERPKQAKTMLSKMIADYTLEQRRIREAEERRLQAEAEKKEAERLLKEAEKLEESGDIEEAEAVLNEPVYVPPVKVAAPPKVSGVKMRENWKFEIVDESKIPREFLTYDEKKIGQYVRAMKNGAKIEGVRVYSETKAF